MTEIKIAVLGPIPRDHITTHNKEIITKYGCVTHTTIALSKLLGTNGTVIPVTHIKKVDEQPIKDIFKPYNNVLCSHISAEADQGDIISLTFLNQNERVEKQTGFMNPILEKDVEHLLDCDAFVMVPVTDFEVPLQTLQYIKSNSNALIVFDAHGPTSTLTMSGERFMKVWVNRDSWLPYIDVLKMNLEEAHCSWFARDFHLEDMHNYDDACKRELPKFAQHCINLGVRAVYITLDSSGGLVYTQKDGKLEEQLVKSVKVDKVIDTTGCGDSFAGGLTYGLLKYKENYIKAAHYANAMGAQRTQGKTFEVFNSLEETDKIIKENYT